MAGLVAVRGCSRRIIMSIGFFKVRVETLLALTDMHLIVDVPCLRGGNLCFQELHFNVAASANVAASGGRSGIYTLLLQVRDVKTRTLPWHRSKYASMNSIK